MSAPEPALGDLADFIAALALAAMGRSPVPGEELPVDKERALWLIGLIEVLVRSLGPQVPEAESQRIGQVVTHLQTIYRQL